MLKYTIAMSIRVVCLVLVLFVDGWWLFVVAAGAICLPYIAVVLANVGAPSADTSVLRPDGVVAIPERNTPGDEDRQAS